jgi:hypothetical protein
MDKRKKTSRVRTADQFFNEMYRDLRAWNREVPESSERMDPILRILLQLYSNQLATIDERVGRTWDVATNSLLKSVVPEARRWPVPAFTVMRCEPVDPVVEIDSHVKFYHKEKREGGQTFFFSTHRTERLLSAEVRHILASDGQKTIDITSGKGPSTRLELSDKKPGQLLVGIEYSGQPSAFADSAVFLNGDEDLLKQVRWGQWLPGGASGFAAESAFCPGVTSTIEQMFADPDRDPVDWGGFRNSHDLFGDLENNWVRLPEKFATALEIGLHDSEALTAVMNSGVEFETPPEKLFWIRVDLAPGGDKKRVQGPLGVYFSCVIVTNKSELTVFKHTGGNTLVEVELPEPVETIVDIVEVSDSNNDDYQPRYRVQNGDTDHSYTLDERDGKLVLWFDFSSLMSAVPDSITVTYTTTAGTDANGIAEGRIADLYERHPGIQAVENLIPVRGGVPAKTEEQLITEVSARLRDRDRALTFPEIANWAKTFDPRIKRVECKNGIERTNRGVRRCIVVRAGVSREDIYSDEESQLLGRRLGRFLKSRAPVNTHFQVEIVAR